MMSAEHIALVGLMGVGKSTVGRLVAAERGCAFEDTDHAIERETGRKVAELFASVGETGFRRTETEVLDRLLGDDIDRVVSCGGGIVTVAENLDLLAQRATVVWLTASLDVLARRVGDGSTRPMLGADPKASLREIGEQRAALYEQIADHVVDTTDRRPHDIAREVVEVAS